MVKEPRPGRVKSRLGRRIGLTTAAWWYRHQVRRLLRELGDPRWSVVLAVSPDMQGVVSRVWPAHLPRIPQGQGDLGLRMARVLAATPGPTVLIGSDIPGIRRHHIAAAFRALGQNASVIGPAVDGGFWLVGLKHPTPFDKRLFRKVRWSHPETLNDTRPTLPVPTATVAILRDVDEASDLRPD
jgi:rSAM/selenodomain-associated transferase 1